MNAAASASGKPLTITLVGCGKMGSALLRGWLAANTVAHVDIIDPMGVPGDLQGHPALTHLSRSRIPEGTQAVVLAIKPQLMDAACNSLKSSLPLATPLLSIMAGKSISALQARFSPAQPILRAMPNTPAAIGQGVTAICNSQGVTIAHKDIAQRLMEAGGEVVWLDDEALMDAVTALSGSGPAYVFYLIEVLARAGMKAGLPPDLAMQLARRTVTGSAALASHDSEIAANELRKNVTSPGGTTEAALEILMKGKLQELFDAALIAARNRSKELSS